MSSHPRICALLSLSLVLGLATPSLATGPQGPLTSDQFDPNSPNYIGLNFGFGTSLNHTSRNANANQNSATGLSGRVISPENIDPSAFNNGEPVPVANQELDDLFSGVTPPAGVNGLDAKIDIEGLGNGQGFNQVTLNQRGLVDLTDNAPGTQSGFVEFYSQFVFTTEVSEDATSPSLLDLFFFLDAPTFISGNGSASLGFDFKLVNLDDPLAPTEVKNFSGFFFRDGASAIAQIDADGEDASDLFSSTAIEDAFENEVAYRIQAEVEDGATYAALLTSDLSAFADGGDTRIDSQNTVGVTLSTLTPGLTLVLPTNVPEPGTLAVAGLGACVLLGRRRRVTHHTAATRATSRLQML